MRYPRETTKDDMRTLEDYQLRRRGCKGEEVGQGNTSTFQWELSLVANVD